MKATTKLSMVLITVSIAPLLLAVVVGVFDIDDEAIIKTRSIVVERLANQAAIASEKANRFAIDDLFAQATSEEKEIKAIRLARVDGLEFFSTPGFESHWKLETGEPSTRDQYQVPIQKNGNDWLNIQIVFNPPPLFQRGWFKLVTFLVFAVLLNSISFFGILRKTLSVLEPSNAVPKRVRNTLDTIAGGVVVLDSSGRIMLANESFTSILAFHKHNLIGEQLCELPWRFPDGTDAPWNSVLKGSARIEGVKLFLQIDVSRERCFVVNASPVLDAKDRLNGALISFEDVTELESQRHDLVVAMTELEENKERIRLQNEKLQEIALRDALTGAYNRRALYERLEKEWEQVADYEQGMVTMMMDIDHFKKLNDTYGHAVGDAVLKDFVIVLHKVVGDRGFVARYGGEEFCVVLTNYTLDQGLEVAEEIRAGIQKDLAEPYLVTTSIGVSTSKDQAPSVALLLEQADKALYASKHGGRNCCRGWNPEIDRLQDENTSKAKSIRSLAKVDDHLVSHHAVVALHAALTFKSAETALHCQRVAALSVSLAKGLLAYDELYLLEISALLHDIGKIGVPDAVLNKPDILTPDEWKLMAEHGPMGVAIVETAFKSQTVIDAVQYHHCRFDGGGAPQDWPKGKDIPVMARIIAIADTFDAMTQDRCYRKGCPPEIAFQELLRCAGTQFDPDLVDRFVRLKSGWRPDSRYLVGESLDPTALGLGYHLERVIHSFQSRDPASLQVRLESLAQKAEQAELPHVAQMAIDLMKDADRKPIGDWESLESMMHELIELGLTVQRAYLGQVGAHTGDIVCPTSQYLVNVERNAMMN